MKKIIPNHLQQGDEIRIIAPSTGIKIINAETREIASHRFEQMGLKVTFGKHTNDDNFDAFGSSSIKDRVEDLMDAFKDNNVKAIFTIIGGFNSNQLLPFLDYDIIQNNPKIICGFSDITALLNGIYAKTGLVTYLGPHYSSFGMKLGFDYTWEMMQKILFGKVDKLNITPSAEWSDDLWFLNQNKREFIKNDGYWIIQQGEAEGTLVGGNLCTQILLLGTDYYPKFENPTILAIEDTESSPAKDFLRNLQALAYQPDFTNVKGIIIGRCQKGSKVSLDDWQFIVKNIPQLKNLPIVANVDFGHTTPQLTLPIGGWLKISSQGLIIKGL